MGSRIKENPESTFEVFLEVAHPGTHSSGPEVRRQYPEDYTDQETLLTVPKFCFPFSMDSLTVSQVGQNFTFVLTDIESKQRFGFCRLSSGAQTCYCILSYLPWFEVFYKLLNIVADYTIKGQESQWQEFLVSLHTLPIPEPGVPVHLGVHSFFTVPDARELPSIPENRNLTEYFVAVDVNNMLHLYAINSVVHGSTAMLFPMHWQHKVRGLALDDVVVLNVSTTTGDGVARAFLRSQAALFGSYRDALHIQPEEQITFNEETFVSHRSSAMRQFLQNAIQLQLFKQFIDGRLDLLNSGEGLGDTHDKTYHQWLFTVKAKDHAKMRIKEVKSRLKQKEQAENGFSTVGSVVIDDESPAVKREGPMTSLDDQKPITVLFGQARPTMMLKRPSSNVSLESSGDHSLRPTRHYTVFLSEDSSGDELQYDEDSISGFPDSFLFSVPFEWSPLPVNEKFSNVTLLGDIFGCQDEPDSQHITLAKSLEDLRTPKDSEELQQAKFTYRSQTLQPYNKLWSVEQDVCVPPLSDRPPSVQLPSQMEIHSLSPSPCLDTLDPSTSGNITIPRPQGRKTPELGGVLAPPATQIRSKPAEGGEGGTSSSGGQEFRQALSMSTDGDLMKSSQQQQLSTSPHSSSKPTLPPRSYPQGLPPFPMHPHMPLNPFSHSLQNTQIRFPPAVGGNPFNAAYGHQAGSYLHTQLRLYRQNSPSYGLQHSAFPSSRPLFSASNHALSSLANSSVPSAAMNLLEKPLCADSDSQKTQDLFGDLLTMPKPDKPPKKKVEDLRRRWETFD
ncbi:hypothetical protein F7725_015169 [Dissostichus mawsoni]|uniref:UDENN domain-containing protein n=1 Tax=Dissostichus mawsoni TaxID=36200 RepID=A0A7J5YGP1_DISMA|nr:hypothetical protein F7725_015169 [Dissostichus mawsoni]